VRDVGGGLFYNSLSGVNRVGVSSGVATDRCQTIFSSKNLTTFLVIASFQLSSPHHTHLHTSFVQCFFPNSATKINFRLGVTI